MMNVVTLFLILVSEIMTTDLKSVEALKIHSSSLQMWVALLSLFL